jgi:hypothetical protein
MKTIHRLLEVQLAAGGSSETMPTRWNATDLKHLRRACGKAV